MKTHSITQLTKDQVKELYFVIHNGKTIEERNNARWQLAYNFENCVEKECQKFLKNINGKNRNFEYTNIEELKDICLDVLFKYTEKYDPFHSSGANLFTYAKKEMKNKMLQASNPGMTETQIRNYNTIYNAQKYYKKLHNKKWNKTEESLIELSNICGLSVKVIQKTLALKQEINPELVSFDAPISENGDIANYTIAETLFDTKYNIENELENKKARLILQFLTKEETEILYTMVDINNNYKLISEREGVRLLAEKGFDIKRGTLKSRREALKRKIWDALYDTDIRYAA